MAGLLCKLCYSEHENISVFFSRGCRDPELGWVWMKEKSVSKKDSVPFNLVNSSLTAPLCGNHQNQNLWLCFRLQVEWFDVRVPLQHFQFKLMSCVWTQTWASNFLTDLTAEVSHQPLSYNLFFHILIHEQTLASRRANGTKLALPLCSY